MATIPAHEKAWEKLVKQLEKQSNCMLLLLQDPFEDDEIPEVPINKKFFLSIDHIFLPKTVGTAACKISNTLYRFRIDWRYGNTSLGNAIWDEHMIPNLEKAQKFISDRKWRKALGILLGIQLAARFDDGWIMDQEVYCDFSIFSNWFKDYSEAWKTILSKTDKQLGFDCDVKRGGYRSVVEDLIRKWEEEINETLEETFDEFMETDDIPARVRIFTEDENDEDEEDKEN